MARDYLAESALLRRVLARPGVYPIDAAGELWLQLNRDILGLSVAEAALVAEIRREVAPVPAPRATSL